MITAVALISISNPVPMLRIFPYIALQNFQYVQLVRSVLENYSFHACNVDERCNRHSVIDEGIHKFEGTGTKPHYVPGHADDFSERQA